MSPKCATVARRKPRPGVEVSGFSTTVSGAYVALALAVHDLLASGKLAVSPLITPVAAVSCGLVSGQALLDLRYSEDSIADADVNVVQTLSGHLVEVQGTAEGAAFPREQLDRLLDLANIGNSQLFAAQQSALAQVMDPPALVALVTTPD